MARAPKIVYLPVGRDSLNPQTDLQEGEYVELVVQQTVYELQVAATMVEVRRPGSDVVVGKVWYYSIHLDIGEVRARARFARETRE